MHKPELKEQIEMPSGVSASVHGTTLAVKGPKGELKRVLGTKNVVITVEGNHITFTALNATKQHKCTLETSAAHARNMVHGVQHAHMYKLKICSGHFPMTVALKGDQLEVKNFIGEAVPRTLKIKAGAAVKINGTEITVESVSKELAGNQAGAIELLTRRPGFDRRVFQDGIYITEKDGKKIE